MLWVHPDDVAAASRKITAHVPGRLDTATEPQTVVPPSSAIGKRLHALVVRKQLHSCDKNRCMQNGSCCFGFPYSEASLSRDPVLNVATKRYDYYRRGYADRNVVPYMPELLLLWGSHCNVQRVTNASWSLYLLKYTLKIEPTGFLNIDS